ncbi:hypothetical protein [Treponema saccharophilum]|uniref:hypothetical protein n=1 Tax=Treponema saccharophilum TaxID=165 RepID=UPI00386C4B00
MNLKNIYNQNVLQLYNIALLEIRKHIAVYDSKLLQEDVISSESTKLLKKIFSALPKMYQKLVGFIEKQENASAINQAKFMVQQLKDIRKQIKSIKETIESHNNNVSIIAEDLASLQILDGLAKEEIDNLKDYLTVLEGA